MYANIKSALAHLISTFGFTVDSTGKDGPSVWWGLYSQGSGMAFDGKLVDPAELFRRMHSNEMLETVAHLGPLLANGDLVVRVKQGSGTYCHGGTMDIEFDGPHTGSGDDEKDADAIERMRKELRDMLHTMSDTARNLLENYFLLTCHDDEALWSFETRNFRVEIIHVKDQDSDSLEWHLDGFEPEERLEEMKRLTAKYGQYRAGSIKAVISRISEDDDEGQVMHEQEVVGCLYETARSRQYALQHKDLVHEGIQQIRSFFNSLKPRLKEAA